MSQAAFAPPGSPIGATRKPKTSIYIILLIVALVALLLGCALLLAEINRHGGFGSVRGRVSMVDRAVESALLTRSINIPDRLAFVV